MPIFVRVFYAELALNAVTIVWALGWPAAFLGQFMATTPPDAAVALARWFGVMVAVVSWALWRALQRRTLAALRTVLEAYLIGDVLFTIIFCHFAATVGYWSLASVFTVVLSVFLAAARVTCLVRPELLAPRGA